MRFDNLFFLFFYYKSLWLFLYSEDELHVNQVLPNDVTAEGAVWSPFYHVYIPWSGYIINHLSFVSEWLVNDKFGTVTLIFDPQAGVA